MSGNEGAMIAQILSHGVSRPDDDALCCGDTSLTWGELRAAILSTAAALKPVIDSGNGRIGLLGSASVELVIAYLATITAGGCAVPLPASAHRDALAGMIADCDPALIVAHDENVAMLDGITTARIETVTPGQGMSAALTASPLAEALTVHPDTDFNIIYSSGTTGRAKGIVHSHSMRYRQAARSIFGLDQTSTMLLATPLYSNTTLMPMLAALFHGGRVILMSKFDVSSYLGIAEKERATHTMLVPVQYQRIIEAPDFSGRDLSAFKVKQSTGAPLTSAIKRRIVEEWPGKFFEVYGLTEGGCTAILDAKAYPDKAHTVGKPAGGNDIRIIDEAGNFLPDGERGEIIGRSATMMSGYLNNEDANRAFYWRDGEGNLYHRTGDIGMFDADGFLVLLDRKKDMIISGGFNIYASDLEEQLLSHPLVAEAAVIAVPSEKWGETPLGLVVAKSGAALDPAEILDWTNARVGKMQRLSAVELRDALPRSNVGKVLKQDLRRPYWERSA
jgi:long-chain acyl-CoA synthetase